MAGSATETKLSWRDHRNCGAKMRVALDWVEKNGIFKNDVGQSRFCLTGGAGGGGKSHNLRTAAVDINMDLRDKGYPNAWGVLMCQTYEDLVGRHIGKLQEEFEGIGDVVTTKYRGLHLNLYGEGLGGVYLRNIVSSGDAKSNKKDKRGFEYHYMLVDELTEFTRDQFDKIIYNLRSGRPIPYSAFLAGTNPDGIGHQWVKELFLKAYRNRDDSLFVEGGMKPSDFWYVPIRVEDNPAYAQNKDIWERNLAGISDPEIRRARRWGDWDIYASGRFAKIWNAQVHVFLWPDLMREVGAPVGMSPAEFLQNLDQFGCECYGSLDYGTSEQSISAYMLHIVDPRDRLWTFAELPMVGKELVDQARMILQFEKGKGVEPITRYCDPALLGRASEDKEGLARIIRFMNEGVDFIPALNDRVEGAASVASALFWEKMIDEEGAGTWIRRPRARIHAECREIIKSLPNLARDPLNPEDVAKNDGKNHWYDSYRYMVHTRYQGSTPFEQAVPMGSMAYWRSQGDKLRSDSHGGDPQVAEIWKESLRSLRGR